MAKDKQVPYKLRVRYGCGHKKTITVWFSPSVKDVTTKLLHTPKLCPDCDPKIKSYELSTAE